MVIGQNKQEAACCVCPSGNITCERLEGSGSGKFLVACSSMIQTYLAINPTGLLFSFLKPITPTENTVDIGNLGAFL
jgi:hypothetical protein